MSVHYILDGYNLIKNSDFPVADKSADQRAALIKLIEAKGLCGNANNKVSIVFDAGGMSLVSRGENLKIIFSYDQSADDKIKEMVSSSQNPKSIIVVSDDRQIQYFIKSYGAKAVKVKDFFAKALEKEVKKSPKVELTYSQAEKINRELKKIWLK